MGKINVLHVIGGNEIGGAEEHVLALCTGLDKDTFQPYLACLCQGPFHAQATQHGIITQTVAMKHPFDITVIPKLIKLMRDWKINIVHTHGSRANLAARLAARWLGISIVTTVHSSLVQDYASKFTARLALLLDRLTTPLADVIITISNFLQPEVKKRGAKRVVTIYNGIDPIRFGEVDNSDDQCWKAQIEPGVPLVGIIGRLHPVKGHRYFLEAASLVTLNHPDAKFLVVGSGPLEEELHQQVTDLGLETKVIFTGYYPHIQRVLPILDVFCLPSVSEGMGLVLLEAMYFRKPVVATKVGGIPELVKHQENGLLVPPGDPILLAAAINRLLEDKALAARLGEKGRQSFEEFSINRMVARTENLYQELIH